MNFSVPSSVEGHVRTTTTKKRGEKKRRKIGWKGG